MPRYDFECTPCAYYSEITQSMQDPAVLECPICGQMSFKKIFISPPNVFVRGEAKTIGQLAERNYKNMGHYEKSDKVNKDRAPINEEQKKKREQHQKIVSMTPEQKVKWIKDGD